MTKIRIGTHGRPSSDLHIRQGESHHSGQRPRRQGWRSNGRAGWYTASIRQYGPYAIGTHFPSLIPPPPPPPHIHTQAIIHLISPIFHLPSNPPPPSPPRVPAAAAATLTPPPPHAHRSSTQSTHRPNTTPKPCTRPKKRAIKRRRVGKTRRRSGRDSRRLRM